MLIIDKNPKNLNRKTLNARMVAINGFSIFGKYHTYLLDEKLAFEQAKLNANFSLRFYLYKKIYKTVKDNIQ